MRRTRHPRAIRDNILICSSFADIRRAPCCAAPRDSIKATPWGTHPPRTLRSRITRARISFPFLSSGEIFSEGRARPRRAARRSPRAPKGGGGRRVPSAAVGRHYLAGERLDDVEASELKEGKRKASPECGFAML